MYQINNPSADILEVVSDVDHGYGNIKTANRCFPSGVITYDREPTFKCATAKGYELLAQRKMRKGGAV